MFCCAIFSVRFIHSRSPGYYSRRKMFVFRRNELYGRVCFERTRTPPLVMRRCAAHSNPFLRKMECRKKNFCVRRSGSQGTAGRTAHSALRNLCLPKASVPIAAKFSSRHFHSAANLSRAIGHSRQRRRYPDSKKTSGESAMRFLKFGVAVAVRFLSVGG